MRHKSILCLTLFLGTASAYGQTASPDSQMTQRLLAEIRELRHDLQSSAATIQRVQIVMYRVQAEASLLNRATERLENARTRCTQAQAQRKMVTIQIESANRQRNSQNRSDQKTEDVLQALQSSVEMFASEEQQCQVEQADAETQFRAEQAKMNDLQDQLENLDKVLAEQSRK
jgi:chromosome segregation ATPase